MISTDTLTLVRIAGYAIAGLACGGYALAALFGIDADVLPHWLPLTAGIGAAVLFSLTAMMAGSHNTAASLDESYHQDRRTAGNLAFWAAILTGTTLWLAQLGGTLQLAITLTCASAVYLLTQVVLELRGR